MDIYGINGTESLKAEHQRILESKTSMNLKKQNIMRSFEVYQIVENTAIE